MAMAPIMFVRVLVWSELLKEIVCLREITRCLASEARIGMKWRRSGGMSAGEEDPIALLAVVSEKGVGMGL
jgi:hypothetical protein